MVAERNPCWTERAAVAVARLLLERNCGDFLACCVTRELIPVLSDRCWVLQGPSSQV